MTIVLGIDIGVTGAIAAVDSRGSCMLHDLPAEEIPGNGRRKRRIDGRALMFLVRDMVPPGEVALAVFEDVHSMPNDNGPSGFSLGDSLGCVRTVLQIARFDVRAVQPQAWKRHYSIKADKNGSLARECAVRLYPNAAALLKRVKDHNRADALLIAHYGRTLL